tara:strand:- start:6917 stop:7924 length:1008 start_codon:yes stop_codon:yes gene_type:complete
MKEENLIFILSQPRSGSTYLQNLLSNNSEVNTVSEPWLLLNFANQIKPSLMCAEFQNHTALDAFEMYKNKISDLDFTLSFKNFILSMYAPLKGDFKFVLDKTPRYWEMGPEITDLFPKAKVVILNRNPIDVAKSMVNTWNIQSFEELGALNRDILLGPRAIKKLEKDHVNNPNVYALNYEDIVKNPSFEIEKLYQWIGINYSPKVLETQGNKKYKGKYGDPFQNKNIPTATAKLEAISDFANSEEFVLFLDGYSRFLEYDSIEEYVSVKNSVKTNSSKIFNSYFDNFPFENSQNEVVNLKKKLQHIEASTKYKIGSFIVLPLQYISVSFRKLFKK